jgi:20S proteasome alpha/beta subunit
MKKVQGRTQLFLVLYCWSWLLESCHGVGWIDVESRHQTSLSTFNTEGKLLQVEYAMEAASMGTPVVVVSRPGLGMVLASPQVLPSPLMLDDGTARFAKVTSNLLVAHSGISADGRILMAACQELAVQHEYVYDEPIPLDIFLEEMSLLFQEYTMKPNARPFGSTLVVASLDEESFYRIDPSGAVECLGSHSVINGDKLQSDTTLVRQLESIANDHQPSTVDQLSEQVVRALEDALRRSSAGKQLEEPPQWPRNLRRVLTATLTSEELVLDSHDLPLPN